MSSGYTQNGTRLEQQVGSKVSIWSVSQLSEAASVDLANVVFSLCHWSCEMFNL